MRRPNDAKSEIRSRVEHVFAEQNPTPLNATDCIMTRFGPLKADDFA
jgi:hypothetical protein